MIHSYSYCILIIVKKDCLNQCLQSVIKIYMHFCCGSLYFWLQIDYYHLEGWSPINWYTAVWGMSHFLTFVLHHYKHRHKPKNANLFCMIQHAREQLYRYQISLGNWQLLVCLQKSLNRAAVFLKKYCCKSIYLNHMLKKNLKYCYIRIGRIEKKR